MVIKIKFVLRYVIILLTFIGISCSNKNSENKIPREIKEYVSEIEYSPLGDNKPDVVYSIVSDSIVKVLITWDLKDSLEYDDWKLKIKPAFVPNFNWSPHLTPSDAYIIPQHVFRSPALIASNSEYRLSVVPDLDLLKNGSPVDWYMDMDAVNNKFILGMSKSKIAEHVLYKKEKGAVYPPGKVQFGFYILMDKKEDGLNNPFRTTAAFFWNKWGEKLYKKGEGLPSKNLEPYVEQTYNWAFNYWKDDLWQYFINENGQKAGAPIFIVNVTKSPNYEGKATNREFISIWNQAWFNSLRSASGLYRYAKRTNNNKLLDYAEQTKELALSFPQRDGFFYSVVAPSDDSLRIGKPWEDYYFGNSNRNPITTDAKKSPFHIVDMSFTSYLMLCWYDELEPDDRLLAYAKSYADALLKKQEENGFFPGWLSLESLNPLDFLNKSPETSMSVSFLLKLYEITHEERYRTSALKAMDAVIKSIIPSGRWEDFETYWSCSRYGSQKLVNKKVKRNNMYKQNNFSMYWTAQALLKSYNITNDKKYMEWGQRTLDEMLMTQASWQPPYMYVPVLGGFGVMNADAEWDDSRQSLFSELIIKYGKSLDKEEYIQRGLAALRASFSMMYSPENKITKKQWEKKWPFFGQEDYGFMMENYGHNGSTSKNGLGIGEFTIYDWGNGAASEAYNRIVDHYGKNFITSN